MGVTGQERLCWAQDPTPHGPSRAKVRLLPEAESWGQCGRSSGLGGVGSDPTCTGRGAKEQMHSRRAVTVQGEDDHRAVLCPWGGHVHCPHTSPETPGLPQSSRTAEG